MTRRHRNVKQILVLVSLTISLTIVISRQQYAPNKAITQSLHLFILVINLRYEAIEIKPADCSHFQLMEFGSSGESGEIV